MPALSFRHHIRPATFEENIGEVFAVFDFRRLARPHIESALSAHVYTTALEVADDVCSGILGLEDSVELDI